ncbi:hypothetical protein COY95_04750 [Candidatus Woesearchaeota archaeon CG_4_10_14_0_8_um_filter_47_5]|nr:MAG: hypothetical protein COY95_04750 [Candidatus Woesearchaeota archaeon CG_4_10_14_0_8_um_filter_47_5]
MKLRTSVICFILFFLVITVTSVFCLPTAAALPEFCLFRYRSQPGIPKIESLELADREASFMGSLDMPLMSQSQVSEQEQALLEAINKYRKSQGLSPLVLDQTLAEASQLYAGDMLADGFFGHVPPGRTSTTAGRALAQGFMGTVVGENLGANKGSFDAYKILHAWEGSPSHYRNLVDNDYNVIGISVLEGDYAYFGTSSTLYVVMFGSIQEPYPPSGASSF